MLVSGRIQLLLPGRNHTEGSRVEGEREREEIREKLWGRDRKKEKALLEDRI